jgi:hypothetical protein
MTFSITPPSQKKKGKNPEGTGLGLGIENTQHRQFSTKSGAMAAAVWPQGDRTRAIQPSQLHRDVTSGSRVIYY